MSQSSSKSHDSQIKNFSLDDTHSKFLCINSIDINPLESKIFAKESVQSKENPLSKGSNDSSTPSIKTDQLKEGQFQCQTDKSKSSKGDSNYSYENSSQESKVKSQAPSKQSYYKSVFPHSP